MDKRIDKLRREISTRESQILAIQEQCEHIGATKKSGSSRSGWEEEDIRNWYSCYCGECGKSWTEDQ